MQYVGSATQPCFNATSGLNAINVPPLVNVGLSAVTGYTQQVPAGLASTNQIFGRAQVVGTSLSVLPAVPTLANPLISTGTIDSVSTCPSDGTHVAVGGRGGDEHQTARRTW